MVTVNILGTNDAAILSSATANLTETNLAADISTSGTLTISDVDSPATFVAQAGTVGSYGTFAIDAAGALDLRRVSAHNEFVGEHLHRHLLGCERRRKPHIGHRQYPGHQRRRDPLVCDGQPDETNLAADISTSGTLTILRCRFPRHLRGARPATVGSYGTFAIDAAGAWTYAASPPTTSSLAETTYTDTFSVASADGTLTSVTVNDPGHQDAAILFVCDGQH